MLNTSLRSAIQATDSTCNGCQAKNAAITAPGHLVRVMRRHKWNSKTALTACNNALIKCWAPGFTPTNSQSSMCDNHVIGCQLLACQPTNAHFNPAQVNPACTTRLSITYAGSSK